MNTDITTKVMFNMLIKSDEFGGRKANLLHVQTDTDRKTGSHAIRNLQ